MNEILLNIMYAGKYIESDNIGHEIINLFKSDQGKKLYLRHARRNNRETP